MPSSTDLRTLTAILALASIITQQSSVDAQNLHLRKNGPRKLRRVVTHIGKSEYKQGLEEDVAFWTKLVRKTQEMSLPPYPVPTPTNPPVPIGTDPPVGSAPPGTSPPIGTAPPVVVDPTGPPVGGSDPPVGGSDPPVGGSDPPVGGSDPPVGIFPLTPTSPPIVVDPTDPPVPGQIDFPTYPPTTAPPGTSPPVGTAPPVVVDPTGPPVGLTTYPPTAVVVDPTNPPVAGTFKCPDASFVGCTAPDPADPQDECPVVGEPCPDGTQGEFCCLDMCPRNYCTAKQAPMSVSDSITFIIPLPTDVPNPQG